MICPCDLGLEATDRSQSLRLEDDKHGDQWMSKGLEGLDQWMSKCLEGLAQPQPWRIVAFFR